MNLMLKQAFRYLQLHDSPRLKRGSLLNLKNYQVPVIFLMMQRYKKSGIVQKLCNWVSLLKIDSCIDQGYHP